jgi:hypothetical protein
VTRLARWLRFAVLGERTRRDPRRRARRGPARDESYKAWIRRQVCCCGCGRGPCDAAHTGVDGGMGQRANDYSCVPLWWTCHRHYHQVGKAAFEREHAIDFEYVVEGLFTEWSAR